MELMERIEILRVWWDDGAEKTYKDSAHALRILGMHDDEIVRFLKELYLAAAKDTEEYLK